MEPLPQLDTGNGLPVLSSTLFVGALLAIGLFFFIRASVKDRTTELQLLAAVPAETIASQLQAYFTNRAYRPLAASQTGAWVFEGFVRPSIGLAALLSLLAACGSGCLALVLTLVLPATGAWPFILVVLSAPAAGWFYWQRAGRVERLEFQIEPQADATSKVVISAHRDELIQLLAEPTLPLQPQSENAVAKLG